MADLAQTLGVALPAEFAELQPDELDALDAALRAARARRSAALTAAIDNSVRHLPVLLRVAVRRALGL